ncbi:heme ABC exporter ATP-binding protein CcmA [Nitrolancea hollandica]|uniref:Heme exporter protein CcmA n=1 Tax=Nitrolancea hollandica Lb TaxID=1129897 RepID=I4EDD3_9BACT|nr:heme ABC exporter ATP-binding protein CcmA [Nitrolancea hollandica]CCF82695.1 Heme exporter protein CcmA [Nitrolancea hollandica Lb]
MNDLRSPELTSAPVTSSVPASQTPRVLAGRITKRFGNRPVLRAIDLRIEPGERVVLFGSNGAGKTTLLRILATLSRATKGTLLIDGLAVDRNAQTARRRIGVVAHQPYLYDDLTAEENLRFFAKMYDVAEQQARIGEVLDLVGLAGRRGDRVRTFSRGMQQRLALARAIVHRPALLLFDEPDTGLDRSGIGVLERILEEQASASGSVLMTTHDLEFGLRSVDRVLLLDGGRLVLDVPAESIDADEIAERMSSRS